jgi:hypothetical protein
MTTAMKLLACLAWVGAAISSAAPADALAMTLQYGAYATCSSNYNPAPYENCLVLNYTQTIKFVNTSCNSGGCSDDSASVRTENRYDGGRKATEFVGNCGGTMNIFELDPCGC